MSKKHVSYDKSARAESRPSIAQESQRVWDRNGPSIRELANLNSAAPLSLHMMAQMLIQTASYFIHDIGLSRMEYLLHPLEKGNGYSLSLFEGGSEEYWDSRKGPLPSPKHFEHHMKNFLYALEGLNDSRYIRFDSDNLCLHIERKDDFLKLVTTLVEASDRTLNTLDDIDPALFAAIGKGAARIARIEKKYAKRARGMDHETFNFHMTIARPVPHSSINGLLASFYSASLKEVSFSPRFIEALIAQEEKRPQTGVSCLSAYH